MATLNAAGQTRDVVVIGASAGGVQALRHLLSKLPGHLPAVVGIVLHRSPYYETQLPYVLSRVTTLPVIEPDDGAPFEPGTVVVAPRDQHLLFERHGIRLSRGPREHLTRPAVDPLFRSAAATFGARTVGMLLTGFGGDGVPGLIAIKRAGGLSLVQDPADAVHPTMPRRAIAEDDVDAILPLDGLAAAIVAMAEGRAVHGAHAEIRG
jgi:two-component system chemotaxis response regulator CheB